MVDLNEKITELNNTVESTAYYDRDDIERNKIMGILAYLSWLVLIPLITAKDSPFARFHCNQGIVLAIAEIVCCTALGILSGLPLIGWIFKLANGLFGLVCALYSIVGIINAANGRAKDLPLIGSFRILK